MSFAPLSPISPSSLLPRRIQHAQHTPRISKTMVASASPATGAPMFLKASHKQSDPAHKIQKTCQFLCFYDNQHIFGHMITRHKACQSVCFYDTPLISSHMITTHKACQILCFCDTGRNLSHIISLYNLSDIRICVNVFLLQHRRTLVRAISPISATEHKLLHTHTYTRACTKKRLLVVRQHASSQSNGTESNRLSSQPNH